MSKDYTFNNMTITINADTPAAAYKQLCELLGTPENVGYATDTYTDCESGEEREVSELFPGQWEEPKPEDACAVCGFSHSQEPQEARDWHKYNAP